ncbi:MAG: hypothetical protein U1A78_30215 [Polyangia bacterium]
MNQSKRHPNPTRALPSSGVTLALSLSTSLALSVCGLAGCPATMTNEAPVDLSVTPTVDLAGTPNVDMATVRPQQPGCSSSEWCWTYPLPQGNALWSVFTTSPTDGWAVGDSGTLLKISGGQLQPQVSPTRSTLYSVWGTDANNVFAVGDRATVLRWDGAKWAQLPITDNTGMSVKPSGLYSVWGAGRNDVWIAGAAGVILHWDGTSVSRVANTQQTLLHSIWGASASSVYAAGANGTILRWDGTRWAAFASMTTENLTTIWGTADNNLYVGAQSGVIRRWNGTTWSIVNPFANYSIYAIWGTDANNVFAVGDVFFTDPALKDATKRQATFLKWDGSKFVALDATNAPKVAMFGLHGTSAQNLTAVGASGTVVTYNAGTFKSSSNADILTGVAAPVSGITGSSSGDLVAVGDWGTTLRYSGNAWSVIPTSPYVRFRGTSGSSDNLFAVAYDFTPGSEKPLAMKWSGTAWAAETITGSTSDLRAVFSLGSGTAYAVGVSETVLKRSGTAWAKQTVALAGNAVLRSVWASGDTVWAVGGGNERDDVTMAPAKALLSMAGSPFQSVTLPATDRILRAVWGADPSNVFAVGDEGFVIRWDGSKWTQIPTQFFFSLRGIWGRSASDFYVVGTSGAILHWDGKVFTQEDSGTNNALLNVFGVGGNLYVTGTGGAILTKPLR